MAGAGGLHGNFGVSDRLRGSLAEGIDLRELERSVSVLRIEVEDKRKKCDYSKARAEDARRRHGLGRKEALRATDDDRAAISRLAVSAYTAKRAASRQEDEDENGGVALLRRDLMQLAQKRDGLLQRRRDVAAETAKDDDALQKTVAFLEAAAQRRSAALQGDDEDAPWNLASTIEREAAAALLARQEGGGFGDLLGESDVAELKAVLETVQRRLDRGKARLEKSRKREGRWRRACLGHVEAGFEDSAREAAHEVGRVVRLARSTDNAARHELRLQDQLRREDATHAQQEAHSQATRFRVPPTAA
ncbi:hypothetical protein M885DRAFT_614048 [Pelagophyceae sp. CCMP2097]|nr:hypothetical protein M885DRAFT_614048 [Pelagophyceae sp. CCMP2097]